MFEQQQKRASLSARLTSLLSSESTPWSSRSADHSVSEPSSRRRSLDAAQSSESMRITRTRPPSPRLKLPPSNLSNKLHAPTSRMNTTARNTYESGPSTNHSHVAKQSKPHPTLPAIRWLAGKAPTNPHHNTPVLSNPSSPLTQSPNTSSPSFTSSAPPSPLVSSVIADALSDDPRLIEAQTHVELPERPQAARLPPGFHASRPHYLSNLTRTTLPTAGLSPPSLYSTTYNDPFEDPFSTSEHNADLDLFYSPTPTPLAMPHSPAPAHVNRSPPMLSTSPTRSSIDSLRSIQERGTRGIHTTSSTQRLSLPNPFKGWLASDGSKDSMDPFLSDEDKASSTQAQKEVIRQRYASPKNPVVFCHGLLGFDTVTVGPSIAPVQVSHWRGIKDALEANGVEVLVTRVPATSTPIDRAKVLEEKISEAYPGRSVHLIGHSMGGLDCRYLTTHLTKRKFKVLSITTISTPHRGSSFADHFLSTIGKERMPSVLSLLDMLPNGGGDGKAFEFLTLDNMRRFNENTPDVPGVKYFSWGAVYEPGLIDTWKWSHSVILEKEGPNDGLVSLKSARWGTYLGTLEGVNHLDLVGWVNTARYKWAEIMGREIKFKPATFYLGITDHLARVVEGQEPNYPEMQAGASSGKDSSAADRQEREEIRQEGERSEMVESLGKGGEQRESRMEGQGVGTKQPDT